MGDEPAPPEATLRRRRLRRVATVVLVIAACVLAPFSVLALWTKTTVLDTANYVAAVSPLARNHDIQEAAATRVTKRVAGQGNLASRVEKLLPPRLAAKANPRAAAESVVHEAALRIVSSEQFAKLWDEANRRIQPQLVAALTGETTRGVSVRSNGAVTLDLSAVARRVRAQLSKRLGVDVNAAAPPGASDTTIELFRLSWIGSVQGAVNLLQKLAWWLPVVTLLCFGGAIALSTNRRRTVLRSGLGISAGMLVILVAIAVARGPYLDLFAQPEGRQAGGAAYDQLLRGLQREVRGLFLLGLLIALGAWIAGREARAPATRRAVANHERDHDPQATSRWASASKSELRIGVIALGFLALAAVDHLTGIAVLLIALGVLVLLALVEMWADHAPSRRPKSVLRVRSHWYWSMDDE